MSVRSESEAVAHTHVGVYRATRARSLCGCGCGGGQAALRCAKDMACLCASFATMCARLHGVAHVHARRASMAAAGRALTTCIY